MTNKAKKRVSLYLSIYTSDDNLTENGNKDDSRLKAFDFS
jgi:hypothetical protein